MTDPRLPRLLFIVLLALGLLQWAHLYPQLPNVMAAHFTANGTPNGYQPKQAFFTLMFVVLGLSAFVAFVTPRILANKPPERINLPNKAYWLSPEHREETVRFFQAQMAWFGCAILFVLLYGTSLAINANLSASRHFDSNRMLYVMVGFCLFSLAWCISFVRHFMKAPSSNAGNPQS
ncbi:MAG TPA: DUF1648 domain-containing protein [Methylomirabilota bacterium]|nr:DUF1648 domain-containing protein [Methylomirabilota bacterium]